MMIRKRLGAISLAVGCLFATLGCGASNSVELPKKPVPMPQDGPVSAGASVPATGPAEKPK